jgi:hypothetical protein
MLIAFEPRLDGLQAVHAYNNKNAGYEMVLVGYGKGIQTRKRVLEQSFLICAQ